MASNRVTRADEELSVLHVGGSHAGPMNVAGVGAAESWVEGSVEVSRRIGVVVVGSVDGEAKADLLDIAEVGRLLGGRLGLGEYGEKDSSKNGDDRNNDQKLNQGKGFLHLTLAKMGTLPNCTILEPSAPLKY